MFMPVGVVPYLQFLGKIFDTQSLACEQYDEMVNHVGSLVNQTAISAVACLDDSLKSFFAHFSPGTAAMHH